ncbi:MAG: hypothetical protein WA001_01605 [Patescibacteria group bacterium]
MSFRAYILFMTLSTAVAWVAWSIVLFNVNPAETSVFGFILFYVTLVTGMIGSLSLIGVFYRVVLLRRKDVISREVKVSFRHALLLSFVAVSALALSSQGLLHWWVLFVLILVVSLFEYASLLIQQSRRG